MLRKFWVLVSLVVLTNSFLIKPVKAEGDEVIEEKPVEGLEVVAGYLNAEGLFVTVAPAVTTDEEGKYTLEVGEEFAGENIFLAARKPGDDSSTQMFTYADPAQPEGEGTIDSKTTGAFNALTAAESDSFTASEADPKQISAVFEAVDKIASETPVATDMASYVGRIADAVALGGTDFAEEALKDIPMDGADKVQYTATLDQAIEPTDYNPLVAAREEVSERTIPAGSIFYSMMSKEFFDKYAPGVDPLSKCEQCTPPGSLGPTDGKKIPRGTFEAPAFTLNPEALEGLKSNPDKPFMIGPGTIVDKELPQLAFQAAPGSFFKVPPPGTARLAPGASVDRDLGINVDALRDITFKPPGNYVPPPGSVVSPDGTVAFNAMFRPPFQLSAEDAGKMMQLPPPAGATAMYNSLDKQASPNSFTLPPMASGFAFGSNAIGGVDPKNFPGQSFAANLEHTGLGATAPVKTFDEFNAAGFVPPNPFGNTFTVPTAGSTAPFVPTFIATNLGFVDGKPPAGVDPNNFFNVPPPPQGGSGGFDGKGDNGPIAGDGGAKNPSSQPTGGTVQGPTTGTTTPTGGSVPGPTAGTTPPTGGSVPGPTAGTTTGGAAPSQPSADKPAAAPPPPTTTSSAPPPPPTSSAPPPPPSGGNSAPPPPQRIKARSIKAKLAPYEAGTNKAGVRSTLEVATGAKTTRLTASKGVYLIGKAKTSGSKASVPIIIDPSTSASSVNVSLGLINNEVKTQVVDVENDAIQLITQLTGKLIEMTTANSGVEDIVAETVTGYLLAPGTSAYKMQSAIPVKGNVVAGESGDIVQFRLPAKALASGVYTITFQDGDTSYFGKLTIGTLKARTISGKALAPNGQL